jgi:DUF971 family protein
MAHWRDALPIDIERICIERGAVRVAWSDGHEGRFEGRWLRAHCPCTDCRRVGTPVRPPVPTKMMPGWDAALHVRWADPDGPHESRYAAEWLRERCPCCQPA